MKLRATGNGDQVERDLDAFAAAVAIATVRATNALGDQAQTAGLRRGAELYGLGVRTLATYARLKPARDSDPEAVITMQGRPFPLSLFNPRKTARGIVITLRGKAVLIASAFLTVRTGARVFSRGRYRAGRFVPGKPRLPIAQRFTFSPADVLANTDVRDAMDRVVEERYGDVLEREIKRAARLR